jgi:hypothetical protein
MSSSASSAFTDRRRTVAPSRTNEILGSHYVTDRSQRIRAVLTLGKDHPSAETADADADITGRPSRSTVDDQNIPDDSRTLTTSGWLSTSGVGQR